MTCCVGRKCKNSVLFQENVQFLCLCFGGQWHNENSDGNLVCKFLYFRKYGEITNISWPKIAFCWVIRVNTALRWQARKIMGQALGSFKARVDPFACFLTCVILRFTSGVTPADCVEVSMAAKPFWSTYLHLQMCPQALLEVRGSTLILHKRSPVIFTSHPSFPVIHKVDNVGIFCTISNVNKLETVKDLVHFKLNLHLSQCYKF